MDNVRYSSALEGDGPQARERAEVGQPLREDLEQAQVLWPAGPAAGLNPKSRRAGANAVRLVEPETGERIALPAHLIEDVALSAPVHAGPHEAAAGTGWRTLEAEFGGKRWMIEGSGSAHAGEQEERLKQAKRTVGRAQEAHAMRAQEAGHAMQEAGGHYRRSAAIETLKAVALGGGGIAAALLIPVWTPIAVVAGVGAALYGGMKGLAALAATHRARKEEKMARRQADMRWIRGETYRDVMARERDPRARRGRHGDRVGDTGVRMMDANRGARREGGLGEAVEGAARRAKGQKPRRVEIER